MARTILYNRYGRDVAFGSRYIATRTFDEVISESHEKDPKRFSENKQTEMFVKPFMKNPKEKICGLTKPLGLLILDTTKKKYQSRFFEKLNKWWNTDLTEVFEIIPATIKNSEDEDIQSFIKWRDENNYQKRLAIVFMGILWFYKDDKETLNEAAKRFYDAHPEFQEGLDSAIRNKYILKCESKYAREIFSSGGLLIHNGKATMRYEFFRDPSAVIWSTLVVKGYMSWIEEMQFISDRDFGKYIE